MPKYQTRKKIIMPVVQKIDPARLGGVAGDYESFVNSLIKFTSVPVSNITHEDVEHIWKNHFNIPLQLSSKEYSALVSALTIGDQV